MFWFCSALQLAAQVGVVTNLNDSGPGSLRFQIAAASAGDTILIDPILWGDTLFLSSDPLSVGSGIVIEGPGADLFTLDNQFLGRHFEFSSNLDTAILRGFHLINGDGSSAGGSLRNNGLLKIEACHFEGNIADRGAAIFNSGTLLLKRCTFQANDAQLQGGALFMESGVVEFDRCTISGNEAGAGAGFYQLAGKVHIFNSTVAFNRALAFGSAFYSGDSLYVSGSIISNNIATGNLQATIAGVITSGGYNLISDTSGFSMTPQVGDLLGSPGAELDPLLDSLAELSSGLPVHFLQCGSPAIDHGNPADSLSDQIRVEVFGGIRDIGAIERDIPGPLLICPDDLVVDGTCDGLAVSYLAPELSDCNGAALSLMDGPISGAMFPSGITYVTYQLSQTFAPLQTCTFSVTVLDDEDPVFFGGGLQEETIALQNAGIASGDRLGQKLAMDGPYLVAGSPNSDIKNFNAGAAVVYRYSEGNWVNDTVLTANDGSPNESLGQSVAISGNQLLVGAFRESRLGLFESGAVYAYKKNSTGLWQQEQKITVPVASNYDWLGYEIAIDGNLACISAPRDDDQGTDAGAVYLLERGPSNWVGLVKLMASDGAAGDWFGQSLALENDVLVVGSHLSGIDDRGAAYVFRNIDSVWVEEARLESEDITAGDNFGWSVAISDGQIMVGAFLADPDGKSNAGAAYVFERDTAGQWVQVQKLVSALAQPGDFSANAIALDHDQVLIGAYGADLDGSTSGTAILYKRIAGSWIETEALRGSASAGQQSGWAVALHGMNAALGAPQASLAGQPGGLVRFFSQGTNCDAVFNLPTDSFSCDRLVEFGEPLADDNCSLANVILASGLGSGQVYPLGETINTYKATDASGRVSICTITVQLSDQTAPIAVCDSVSIALPTDSTLTITAADVDAGSFDGCGGPVSLALTGASPDFNCPDLDQPRVFTLIVSDSLGNASSCFAPVTLTNPYPALTVVLEDSVAPSAPGAADGILEILPDGGLAPYQVFWSTGDTTLLVSGLTAGLYTVVIYDAHCQSISVEFTLQDPPPPCSTDVAPSNLRSEFTSDGVVMRWDPIPESVGCRVKGKSLFFAFGFSTLPPVIGFEPDSAFVSRSRLPFAGSYIWRVQCACNLVPALATPFSLLDTFFVPFERGMELEAAMNIWPVPAQDLLQWQLNSSPGGQALITVVDVSGREYNRQQVSLTQGNHIGTLQLNDLPEGFYWLNVQGKSENWRQSFVINRSD